MCKFDVNSFISLESKKILHRLASSVNVNEIGCSLNVCACVCGVKSYRRRTRLVAVSSVLISDLAPTFP